MASFSLFPKIETDEERIRREDKLRKKPAQPAVPAVTTAATNSTAVADLASPVTKPSREIPTLQRQPSNPDLSSRSIANLRYATPQHRSKKPLAPTLRTSVSSPGLYSPPTPRTDALPALPKTATSAARRPEPSQVVQSPANISPPLAATKPVHSSTNGTAAAAAAQPSSRKASTASATTTTPSPGAATSPNSTLSPASTRSSSYSVIYPTIPTAQSPVIKPSPPKERLQQKLSFGSLPPPPPLPLPTNKKLVRANTTATFQSASTLRSVSSSTAYSSADRTATARPSRSITSAGAPRSIFPVFDPGRPFAEQQHAYTLKYQPAAPQRRALTQKALEEAQHDFLPPPLRFGPRSVGSGITRASTARSLGSSYAIKQHSSSDLALRHGGGDEKHAAPGIMASTTLVVSQQNRPARPSTSSGLSSTTKQKPTPDSQHGVSAAFDACAFAFGVGVEVVGGAVGGLRRGVRKERAKRQRRDERRASKRANGNDQKTITGPEEAEEAEESDDVSVGVKQQPHQQRPPSPGWLVGEGGARRVTDFRI